MRNLHILTKNWPVAGVFRISRSALSTIPVVHVEISEGTYTGRAECRPYARYEETVESVTAQIESIRADIENGLNIKDLQSHLPAGAARNAVDCALWDLQCQTSGHSLHDALGTPRPRPRITAFTLSMDTPEAMAEAAKTAITYPLLKMKIGGIEGLAAIKAVTHARPDADLIIDANEALNVGETQELMTALRGSRVVLIEQPLPASEDNQLPPCPEGCPPICADESLHTRDDLDQLWLAGYRAVNVKLDKCGGLTEAYALMQAARARGFVIMAGCMVGSSLAIAPMITLESYADFIDLDGPLLLAEDDINPLRYEGATLHPPL